MFRSLQLTETCRLNFSQANVILKDPVVVDQTLVAMGVVAPLQDKVLPLVVGTGC